MNQDERENFFTEPATHLMTAQYLNECVHKHIGLAVVDRESDTWGWVHDQHKNESGWVIGDTHDDRIQELRDGAHIKPALPAEYEKYEFVEETDPTETTYAEHPRIAISGYNPDHEARARLLASGGVSPHPHDDYEPYRHVPVNDLVSDPIENKRGKPYIIAVEGIDGAGKNTYTQKLAALLNAQVISFPQYGLTAAAELIEGGLRNAEKYSPWHMAQLFAADRKESAHLLRGPGVIIVDRYVASNAAYLHAKTGYHDAYDAMETLEYDTLGLPKPDLQIFVDTPVAVAMGRVKSRAESEGGEPDTNETDQGLQERVRASYLKMVETQWVSPWIMIDGQAQK